MPLETDTKTSEIKEIKKEDFFKIFFNHTCNAGVTYYRMINFAKYMRKIHGVSVAYSKYDHTSQLTAEWEIAMIDNNKVDQYIKDFNNLMETADISIWQYIHSRMGLACFQMYRNTVKKPILVEIDDDLFNVNPDNLGAYGYYAGSNAEFFAEQQLRNAHGVICSTDWLAKQVKRFNTITWVIPNSIDFQIWDNLKKPQRHKNIRIGWSGSDSHQEDLRILKDIVPVILKKYRNVEFYFLGGFPVNLEKSNKVIHYKSWADILSYPQALKDLGLDIGLAPLKDNLFNRSKSNLRYLEYSALKIPTVASQVEPFDFIENKNTGLKVMNISEWVDALSFLIENETERRAIGRIAYDKVKTDFNAEINAKKYYELLKRIKSGKEGVNIARYENGNLTVEV